MEELRRITSESSKLGLACCTDGSANTSQHCKAPSLILLPPLLIYLSHTEAADPLDVSPPNHLVVANRSLETGTRYRFDQIYCAAAGLAVLSSLTS